MRLLKVCFFVLLLFSVKFSLAKENETRSKFSFPPYREYQKSSFYLKGSQGIGFRNVSWDLDLTFQFRNYISLGVGNGIHRNRYPIYSTSDRHVLKMWSYPAYFTGNIFLFANEEKAVYIYGKYGRSFGIRTKNVNPTNDFEGKMIEGGIGYQHSLDNVDFFAEIGQHYYTANGVFTSTYNSTISYDLTTYTLVARFGLKFNLLNRY
jgi:hypothetical protein